MLRRMGRHFLPVVLAWSASLSSAAAQDEAPRDTGQSSAGAWQWEFDAHVVFGLNHQDRKFRDFTVWESQNWTMARGERALGRTTVSVRSMVSLEPWTVRDIGSPQVFQTGETFQGGALIDYQHPHDLLMAAGGDIRLPVRDLAIVLGADLVGSPTLGPPAFMHRPSARLNPQSPLAHHHLDATHITPGVVRAGLEARAWRVEGSWFRGREPDEDRVDVDLGALDSYAVRIGWSAGAWSAQASAGWLTKPEAVTPYDAKKLTASLSHSGAAVAWMLAFGQKREIHGNSEAYLFEATWRARRRDSIYTRVETVAKDILDVGFHPTGTFHRHRQSQVSAATAGYIRDLIQARAGVLGLGMDITGYAVPSNLKAAYGSPISFHAFVIYRLRSSDSPHSH